MLKLRFLALLFSGLTPFVINSFSVSVLAQGAPSRGPAGFTSGSAPTGGSQTVISVPTTITAPGGGGVQPVSGNISVTTTAGGQPVVTIPPAISTAVSTAGSNAVITFSTGSLSQQQIATLVSAVAPTVVNNTNAEVPGGVTIETQSSTGGTISSSTATTMGAAITALATQLASPSSGGRVSIQVGNVRVVISSRVAGGQGQGQGQGNQ